MLLCASKLYHEVPNSDLYLMETVGDVVSFYQTPVRGIMTYDHLIREQNRETLPQNLHVVAETVTFNPNSEFMEGLDAFPGNPDLYTYGIREKSKFPPVKHALPWPDV